MRLLLIEPPFHRLYHDRYSLDRFPLALGYLSGIVLKKPGWEVRAYNADFHPQPKEVSLEYMSAAGFDSYLGNLKDPTGPIWREVRESIASFAPDVVGISSKTQNFASARIVARLAKEVSSKALVVVGGPHPSMVGTDVLACPEIDVGVVGEGEVTLAELLDAFEGGRDLSGVRGLVLRRDGNPVATGPRDFIENLDDLPFPHESAPRVLKDFDKYATSAFRNIFAIRGCPYKCSFCGSRKIWSRKPRFRSVGSVVAEMKALREKGHNHVHFDDDTFGVSRKYIAELCRGIAEHCPGLRWSCEMHVRLVDPEVVAQMKAAGCFQVQIGIESGSDTMLKAMNKNITIAQAHQACRTLTDAGLRVQTFFMAGLPQETEETLAETVAAIRTIRCDEVIFSVFTPYPGTDIFQYCREKGLVGDDYDVSLYNHHSPANAFCLNIPPERLRQLIGEIEKMVDRRNYRVRLKRYLSPKILSRVREEGLVGSLRLAMRKLGIVN